MVKITEELVRKKSEHNELEICTLEELSLHQEHIEKIEHIQNWCKNLQILLLQGNIISRIENLHKLKKLQYLNLAMNNIEIIENLEKCESLEKLDLTLNFIGNIESVSNLRNNIHFKELNLTGNPCTDFKNYRNYVIAKLPQLQNLDGTDILRSERIKALQIIDSIENQIKIDQNNYKISREEQRIRQSKINRDIISDDDFWKEKTENCPEIRVEMSKRQLKAKESKNKNEIPEKETKLFNNDGRPLNMNQPKLKFHLDHYETNDIILTLEVYKYLDTNLIDVDIQPNYVTVKIKKKIFQIVLPEEINTTASTAQRSQTTGFLVIKMPKVNVKNILNKKFTEVPTLKEPTPLEKKLRREYLQIGSDRLSELFNVIENTITEIGIIDDESVPPLE